MVQVAQKAVRRYMGVGSTVVGLACYALSSSFNRLYGDWNSFKICAYIVSSSIICLATLFPKAWQHLRIFHYRAHFAFLVLISTTVYSFYLDRKSKMKPDAYGVFSSAAFAMTSLCMSKQIVCGFLDLMYFFCGLLVMKLMQIKPLLVFVGIGFGYFLVILHSYLDTPPNRSQSQPPQVVIDMASLLQCSALYARSQEEEEGSNQNQATIGPVCVALISGSLQSRSSISRASRVQLRVLAWIQFIEGKPILHTLAWKLISYLAIDDILSMSSHHYLFCPDIWVLITPRTSVVLGGDWIHTNQARVLEIFQDYQRSYWNMLLDNLHNSRNDESLIWDMIGMHSLFNVQFKDMFYLLSNWLVSDKQLRDNLKTSLENKFLELLDEHAHNNFIKYEVPPDVLVELEHSFRGTREIDQPLGERGKKLKIKKLKLE